MPVPPELLGRDGPRRRRVGADLDRGEGAPRTSRCSCRRSNGTSSCATATSTCFEPRDEPYDILLDDFEPEMETAEVRRIFDEIKPRARRARRRAARARRSTTRSSPPTSRSPRRRRSSREIVDLFGTRPSTWRIDPTEHPFAGARGPDDIRITTHYYADSLESLFSTMHEYGHGLYEHQIPGGSRACRSAPAPRSASTSRRAGCGRTSSAAASRSGASSTRGSASASRSSSAASTSSASTRASTRCSRR